VDVFVGGRSGVNPKLAIKILEDVPCDKLPGVLEGMVPYHTREKMHRVRGGEVKKTPAAKQPEPSSGSSFSTLVGPVVLKPA